MKPVYLKGYSIIETTSDETGMVYRAETADLKNFINPRELRRVDAFTRMALLSVEKAVKDYEITLEPLDTGLVLGSVNGPINASLRFLENLQDDGDEFASPTWFSTSIHNTMAAQLSLKLDIQGPTRTITADSETLKASLFNAADWLSRDLCKTAIVCIGDEASEIFSNEKGQHDGFVCMILGLEGFGSALDLEKLSEESDFEPYAYPTKQAERIISLLK